MHRNRKYVPTVGYFKLVNVMIMTLLKIVLHVYNAINLSCLYINISVDKFYKMYVLYWLISPW